MNKNLLFSKIHKIFELFCIASAITLFVILIINIFLILQKYIKYVIIKLKMNNMSKEQNQNRKKIYIKNLDKLSIDHWSNSKIIKK